MGFTHFDENGKAVMVDVTAKSETEREVRDGAGGHSHRPDRGEPGGVPGDQSGHGRQGRCARRCGHSRDHGGEAYFGSDPHVPYPADHELQDPF